MKSFLQIDGAGSGGGPAHQQRVDRLVAQARAEAAACEAPKTWLKPAPAPPALSSDPLDQRLAQEIDYVRRHLDLLGDVLSNEPILLHRHGRQLQAIDMIGQLLGHLGRVIAAEDRPAAVARITLEDLRARLARTSLQGIA